jgi:hypothetical protein
MKLNFLQLPSEDRKLYIEEAAGRRGLSPVILEKDFWVCWLLHVLFDASEETRQVRTKLANGSDGGGDSIRCLTAVDEHWY